MVAGTGRGVCRPDGAGGGSPLGGRVKPVRRRVEALAGRRWPSVGADRRPEPVSSLDGVALATLAALLEQSPDPLGGVATVPPGVRTDGI